MKNYINKLKLIISFSIITILTITQIKAQIECNISINSTIPVCPTGIYTLSVTFQENAKYEWSENGNVLEGSESEITLIIEDQTTFSVTVTDTITLEDCTSDLFVSVLPGFTIDFKQWQLTCTNGSEDNGNTAKVQAYGIGAQAPEKYVYKWDVDPIQIAPGTPSLAISLKAHQYYNIEVIDSLGCSNKDKFWTESYPNPEVEVFADPDTAYLPEAFINFSFINNSEGNIGISDHYWDFGDNSSTSGLENPTHRYYEVGHYTTYLVVFNDVGCDTIFLKDVYIRLGSGIPENSEQQLAVFRSGNSLTVENKTNNIFTSLIIISQSGQELFRKELEKQEQKSIIDIYKWPTGIYIIRVETEGQSISKKFIKI